MSINSLLNMLQLSSGTFPSGGFSHSRGLETYVSEGKITNGDDFKELLETYIEETVGKCEGPIVKQALELVQKDDIEGICKLEELSVALKITGESRKASMRMGRAVVRVMVQVLDNKSLNSLIDKLGKQELSYPVAYGIMCGIMRIAPKEAITSYVFSSANSILQSGLKLIPLGNTEAQKILYEISSVMEASVKQSLEMSIEDITNFSPSLDIASLKHEILPIRLYMS